MGETPFRLQITLTAKEREEFLAIKKELKLHSNAEVVRYALGVTGKYINAINNLKAANKK